MSRPSLTGDFGKWLFLSSWGLKTLYDVCRFSQFFSIPQGFAVTGYVDNLKNSRIVVSEVLPDGLAFSEGTFASEVTAFISEFM